MDSAITGNVVIKSKETETDKRRTNNMTQCDRILEFIGEHGAITDDDAKNMRPRIHRLASRVHDLRKMGYNIVTDTIYGKNEYGKWHCARYRMGE